MGKRTSPSGAEQLQVMRLLADVAALKADPPAQRQYLVDSLNGLFHTRCGQLIVGDGFAPGRQLMFRHWVLCSDPDPLFVRAGAEMGHTITPDTEPYVDHTMNEPDAVQLWSRDRVLSRPGAKRRYAVTLALEDEAGVKDGAVAVYRTGAGNDRVVAVALHRVRGEGMLRPADHALLAFAMRELKALADRGHLPLGAPAPALPPRLAQVLERLLRGDGVKQVARELGLSVWTVREHVQRLYRHFGVSNREGLTARFVNS